MPHQRGACTGFVFKRREEPLEQETATQVRTRVCMAMCLALDMHRVVQQDKKKHSVRPGPPVTGTLSASTAVIDGFLCSRLPCGRQTTALAMQLILFPPSLLHEKYIQDFEKEPESILSATHNKLAAHILHRDALSPRPPPSAHVNGRPKSLPAAQPQDQTTASCRTLHRR